MAPTCAGPGWGCPRCWRRRRGSSSSPAAARCFLTARYQGGASGGGGPVAGGPWERADSLVRGADRRSLQPLLPRALREEPFFAGIEGIPTSPIVNVHLWYDRQVTELEVAGCLNTPLQWLFNKSKLWGQEGDGQDLGSP